MPKAMCRHILVKTEAEAAHDVCQDHSKRHEVLVTLRPDAKPMQSQRKQR